MGSAIAKVVAREAGEDDVKSQLVPSEKVTKKRAALKGKKDLETEDCGEADEEDDADEQEESPEKTLAEREAEIKIERAKELKSMYMDELKTLATESGLATGTKDAMIK